MGRNESFESSLETEIGAHQLRQREIAAGARLAGEAILLRAIAGRACAARGRQGFARARLPSRETLQELAELLAVLTEDRSAREIARRGFARDVVRNIETALGLAEASSLTVGDCATCVGVGLRVATADGCSTHRAILRQQRARGQRARQAARSVAAEVALGTLQVFGPAAANFSSPTCSAGVGSSAAFRPHPPGAGLPSRART